MRGLDKNRKKNIDLESQIQWYSSTLKGVMNSNVSAFPPRCACALLWRPMTLLKIWLTPLLSGPLNSGPIPSRFGDAGYKLSTIFASFLNPPVESLDAFRDASSTACRYMAYAGRETGRVGNGRVGVDGTVKVFERGESPAPARRRAGRGKVVYAKGQTLTSPLVYL